MKRILLLLLALTTVLSFSAASLGDGLFDAPLEIVIGNIHADRFIPLDEQRLGELNQLLGHVSLSLRTGKADDTIWSGISVQVDDLPVDELWLGESGSRVLLVLPGTDTAYSANDLSALDTLLGMDPIQVSEMMLPDLYLKDAETMVDAVFAERNGIEITKESQTVRDTNEATYGRVISRYRIKDAAVLAESLAGNIPDGALKRFLSDLSITEVKDCYALCKKDGKAAKVLFAGKISDKSGKAYEVSFEWKLRRGEKNAADRDHLTVSYKGDSGTGSFEFRLTRKNANEVTYDIYSWEKNGFTVSKQKKDTIHITKDDNSLLKGEIAAHLAGGSQTSLSLQFDLLTADTVSGNIHWKLTGEQDFSGTAVLRSLDAGEIGQPNTPSVVPLPGEETELESIAQTCSAQFAAKLMAHLVLLENQEDTVYLRKDLSGEAWSEIVTAARELLGQTGGEEE